MTSALYEPSIERDLEGIAAQVRAFRQTHSSEELWQAVARFAVLAYAPSQHARHAVLACLAAWELREQLGPTFDDVVLECARYTAESRQPWSEPPIFDPPPFDPSQRRDPGELREAIAAQDRLRAERWLAARLADHDVAEHDVAEHDVAEHDLAADLFSVAVDGGDDPGQRLIVVVAAWKLAAILGEKGRFVALRMAIWELTARSSAASSVAPPSRDRTTEETLRGLIAAMVSSGGDLAAAHALFAYEAALEAAAISGDESVVQRVGAQLEAAGAVTARELTADTPETPLHYRFARDYGTYLQAHAVARRLARRFPTIDAPRIIDAARHNLVHGSSFEDFTFA